jgi:uncharacterized protein (TIGR02266 family)
VLQERRRHPRLEVPLESELRLAGSEEEITVTMQDLSAGGAGLLTSREIPVGSEIEWLRFELPASGDDAALPIEMPAKVARCLRQTEIGGEFEYLIGIQFVDISRELFDRIQKFVFKQLRADEKVRVPIERPIAIRFDRFDDFVEEMSVNLSSSGMFIRTRNPRPPGSVFDFQFQLGDDFSLIEGRAEVIWRRRSEGPDKPPGMGVKFASLDVSSQRLIARLVAQKRQQQDEQPGAAASETEPTAIEPKPDATPAPAAATPTGAAAHDRPTPPDLEQA